MTGDIDEKVTDPRVTSFADDNRSMDVKAAPPLTHSKGGSIHFWETFPMNHTALTSGGVQQQQHPIAL